MLRPKRRATSLRSMCWANSFLPMCSRCSLKTAMGWLGPRFQLKKFLKSFLTGSKKLVAAPSSPMGKMTSLRSSWLWSFGWIPSIPASPETAVELEAGWRCFVLVGDCCCCCCCDGGGGSGGDENGGDGDKGSGEVSGSASVGWCCRCGGVWVCLFLGAWKLQRRAKRISAIAMLRQLCVPLYRDRRFRSNKLSQQISSSSRSSDGNSSLFDEGSSASQVPQATLELAGYGSVIWPIVCATIQIQTPRTEHTMPTNIFFFFSFVRWKLQSPRWRWQCIAGPPGYLRACRRRECGLANCMCHYTETDAADRTYYPNKYHYTSPNVNPLRQASRVATTGAPIAQSLVWFSRDLNRGFCTRGGRLNH